MHKTLIDWAVQSERNQKARKLALHPVAGEILGSRFMRAVNVPTANVELTPEQEAQSRPNWILKFRLDDGRILAIEKVHAAISLAHLRILHGIETNAVWNWPRDDAVLAALHLDYGFFEVFGVHLFPALSGLFAKNSDVTIEVMRCLLGTGKPSQLPNAPEDFKLLDVDAIRRGIAWDGTQMLAIHAARLILGVTLAHVGNVLVDGAGTLYSIDHEKIEHLLHGSDIEMLATHMKRGTRAHQAVESILARLNGGKMRSMFDGLPDIAWPLGSKDATVDYFIARLEKFQSLFGEST